MKFKDVKHSPFSNTYGGLALVLGGDNRYYLRMGDCFGPDYYGPLTEGQVEAFYILVGVEYHS